MKATLRNEREKGYAKHNDRDFDIYGVENDGHIDPNRMHLNTYWKCIDNPELHFDDAEKEWYTQRYTKRLESQNAKYIKKSHPEKCRTINDLLNNRTTKPEETILQIGDKNETVDLKVFEECVFDYLQELQKYDENIHILDWAIHADEETPHAHIRKVYDYEIAPGEFKISQAKALEQLGFQAPDPTRPIGQTNNAKMAFDEHMREIWYDICEEHNIQIEREPRNEIRENQSRTEYIRQQEEAEMQERMMEMQRQIEEMEQQLKDVEEQKKKAKEELEHTQQQTQQLTSAIFAGLQTYAEHTSIKEARKLARQHDLKEFAPAKEETPKHEKKKNPHI